MNCAIFNLKNKRSLVIFIRWVPPKSKCRKEPSAQNNCIKVGTILKQLTQVWCFVRKLTSAFGKWFSQCSLLLQGLFRNSSSASATLDLQNSSFSRRFEHHLNHFCGLWDRCVQLAASPLSRKKSQKTEDARQKET